MEIARRPVIINLVLTTAGVEQSLPLIVYDPSLPTVKKVQIKSRTSHDLKFSWITAGDFVTIFAGQTYWEDNLEAWNLELFLTGTVDGQVAEVEVWF